MKLFIAAGAAAGLLLAAGPALALDQPVDLSSVEVLADTGEKLTVEVAGSLGPKTVVLGDRAGINCGAFAYRFTQGENRQCWVWVQRGATVTLTTRDSNGPVVWKGCEVVDGGKACRVTMRQAVTVHVTFP